jgi:type I restriction enzyme S subunit
LNEYIYYFLSSPLFRSDFDGISTTTINQITQSNLRERLIPLPPLAEQQRIISKLAQILPQLERLQADENKLHAMQTAFPSRMKASLLQAAIEGKLTTQDPKADGTASDLLKQIQTEKQRLIDAKEIKRERPLPAIVDEEKPFDIPDNWEWVRLSQIGEIISGGTPKTTNLKYWQNGDIPWITPADMKNVSKYISKGARNITKAGLTSSSARLMPKGSVLFSSRAPIGYVAIAENEISTNQGFKSIVPFNFNLSEYLYFALMALANDIAKLGTGTTFKEVSGATVSNILIPLPPLAEQERIVAKLDALLPKVQALNDL